MSITTRTTSIQHEKKNTSSRNQQKERTRPSVPTKSNVLVHCQYGKISFNVCCMGEGVLQLEYEGMNVMQYFCSA